MFEAGARVLDRRTRCEARIAAVERVPAGRDLFGRRLPGHRRLILQFPDGRWANDRLATDVEPLAVRA